LKKKPLRRKEGKEDCRGGSWDTSDADESAVKSLTVQAREVEASLSFNSKKEKSEERGRGLSLTGLEVRVSQKLG